MAGARENLNRLDEIAADAEGLSIRIQPGGASSRWERFHVDWSASAALVTFYGDPHYYNRHAKVSEAIEGMLQARPVDRLDFESLEVKTRKSPVKAPQVRPVVIKALHEAMGLPVPSDEELEARAKAKKTKRRVQTSEKKQTRAEILAELRGGPTGIETFNRRKRGELQQLGPYRQFDFSGKDLTDVNLSGLDFRRCKFRGAILAGANLGRGCFANADFSDADLRRVSAGHSDLTGAVLTGSMLEGAVFERTNYDGDTVFPDGFAPDDRWNWYGAGPDPAAVAELEKRQAESGPVDLPGFMDALDKNVDAKRLKKALKMLKADRFELFSDVGVDHVVGVIKSQTDESLVYAASLTSSGGFACCTQNLNSCGGLRGALCKHILVLIIGLTSSGALDANTVNLWVEKSKLQYPALDKDSMSEVFLRYKGAEAGEVDWRPTETTPEDYYAF